MSEMSTLLAEFYGTAGDKTASAADEDDGTEAVELFCKVAADNNIDLSQMPDHEVAQLFDNFIKNASDSEDEDDEDKKEKAKHELEEKKEAAAEFAKYDFCGRQMAHAYVDELRKIAAASEEAGEESEEEQEEAEEEAEEEKAGSAGSALTSRANISSYTRGKSKLYDIAAKVKKKVKAAPSAVGHAFKGTQRSEGRRGAKALNSAVAEKWIGKHVIENMPKGTRELAAKDIREEARALSKKNIRHGTAKMVGAYGGAGVAAGAAGVGIHRATRGKRKESSAIDELAIEEAIYKAAEAGFDVDEAADRSVSVLTLGLDESDKLASANDVDMAVEIRSLEILEAAGYPINWA